jgi:hypothetical protein
MPPTETQTVTEVAPTSNSHEESQKEWKPQAPLQLSGALDSYKSFDVTPIIGREFADVSLKDWLRAPNSDELIRDLAITSKAVTYLH